MTNHPPPLYWRPLHTVYNSVMRGRKRIDLTGQKFERLRVLSFSHSANGAAWWKCLCDPDLGGCGTETTATGSMLRDGRHKSCGCLRRELATARLTKHGNKPGSGASRTWNSWSNMTRRCTNPNHPRYADWGGRGITIDPRWADFRNFLADMGERPPGTTLHRKDNDGNYCRENCEWATPAVQAAATRSVKLTPALVARIVQLSEDGMTMTAIVKVLGIGRHTVSKALFNAR